MRTLVVVPKCLTMGSLKAIIWCLYFINRVKSGDYCLWGRASDQSNTIVNGEYIEDVVINGKPSYYKTDDPCSPVTIYLYWSNTFNFWGVGKVIGDSAFYTYCKMSDLSLCTAGNWIMAENGAFISEPNLYVQSGSCPQVYI